MNKEKDFKWVVNNEDDLSKFIHIFPRYEDGQPYIHIHIGTSEDGFVFRKNINDNYIYNLMEKLILVSKAINNEKDNRNGH
tara:strand:+ start:216 stop:458 length:243 start_codon:yes stop_codon:yes gene_type:complete